MFSALIGPPFRVGQWFTHLPKFTLIAVSTTDRFGPEGVVALCAGSPFDRPCVRATLVTALLPKLFQGACSCLIRPFTLLGAWIRLIMEFLCSVLVFCGTLKFMKTGWLVLATNRLYHSQASNIQRVLFGAAIWLSSGINLLIILPL